MARESVTIQVYPDESDINNKIKRYEIFGWEVVSNQRMQQFVGQTKESDGKGGYDIYDNYETYNMLTFSREKNMPWYDKIVLLENEYISLEKEYPFEPEPFSIVGFLWRFLLLIIPAIIYIRNYVLDKQLYEWSMDKYENEILPRMHQIEIEAQNLISNII